MKLRPLFINPDVDITCSEEDAIYDQIEYCYSKNLNVIASENKIELVNQKSRNISIDTETNTRKVSEADDFSGTLSLAVLKTATETFTVKESTDSDSP